MWITNQGLTGVVRNIEALTEGRLIYNWIIIWGLLLLIFVFFLGFWKSLEEDLKDLLKEKIDVISRIGPLIVLWTDSSGFP